MATLAETLAARSVRNENGCLLWTGYREKTGYGAMSVGGRFTKVHRVAWQLANGDIPAGMKVCHSCDVRNCIEPTHLWLGTQADNIRDMYEKGRHRNIGGWNAGRPHSAETRAKMSEAKRLHTGWRHSPETRAKMAEARRKWWTKKADMN
jgi:hypothetical protein